MLNDEAVECHSHEWLDEICVHQQVQLVGDPAPLDRHNLLLSCQPRETAGADATPLWR